MNPNEQYKKSENQRKVYLALSEAGSDGLTWREAADIVGEHHGVVSGALSEMHRRGEIVRLTKTRMRCKVYVVPSEVYGRSTEAQGVKHAPVVCWNCGAVQ